MFHATFMMILTCFIHIICHYYAFSGTNLLTRCRSASSCFLLFLVSEILVWKYSRNRTKSKPNTLFFPEGSRASKKYRRGARGAPHARAARPRGGARPPSVWAHQGPSEAALPPTYGLRRENPTRIDETRENLPEPPPSRNSNSGDRGLCSGTMPVRGIAA